MKFKLPGETFIQALLAGALALTAIPATAGELPACNSGIVVQTLASVIKPTFIVDIENYEKTPPSAAKRWCYTYFSSRHTSYGYQMGSPWQEAIFTIEWTNQVEGHFWLQVIQQQNYRKYGNERDHDEIKFENGQWVSTHRAPLPPVATLPDGRIDYREFPLGCNWTCPNSPPVTMSRDEVVKMAWLKICNDAGLLPIEKKSTLDGLKSRSEADRKAVELMVDAQVDAVKTEKNAVVDACKNF